MRYLIKYSKEANIKFISHLDLLRTIQRAIRRSGLPIHYSKGFNPHMATSIAQPLSVGVYSTGEYMDMILDEEVSLTEILERLNSKSPAGIRFLNATLIPEVPVGEKKTPQAMALIDGARYIIKIKYSDLSGFNEEMDKLMNMEEWTMVKRSKKTEREVDIKPMVHEIKYWTLENEAVFNVLLSAGSREHLSADLFIELIKKYTRNVVEDEFVDIKREEMYFSKGEDLVPLYDCVIGSGI